MLKKIASSFQHLHTVHNWGGREVEREGGGEGGRWRGREVEREEGGEGELKDGHGKGERWWDGERQ